MTLGVVLVLTIGGLWVLSLVRYPLVTCTHCKGKKREYASDEEHYHKVDCFWCYDSGERYRWELRWLTLF